MATRTRLPVHPSRRSTVAEWVERTGDVAVFGRYFSEFDELKVRVWRIKAKVTEIQL
jgi:hypothetical protein